MQIESKHLIDAITVFVKARGDLAGEMPGAAVARLMSVQLRDMADKCDAIGMPHEGVMLRSVAADVSIGVLDWDAEQALADPQRAAAMLAADLDLVCSSLGSILAAGIDANAAAAERAEALLSCIHLDGRVHLNADGSVQLPPHAIVQDHIRRVRASRAPA